MFKSIFSQSLNYNFTCKANCKHVKTGLFWTRTAMGITKIMPIVRLFFQFSELEKKQWLSICCHIHIWQVSLQLSCSDTCQILMWFKAPEYMKAISHLPQHEFQRQNIYTDTPYIVMFVHDPKCKWPKVFLILGPFPFDFFHQNQILWKIHSGVIGLLSSRLLQMFWNAMAAVLLGYD